MFLFTNGQKCSVNEHTKVPQCTLNDNDDHIHKHLCITAQERSKICTDFIKMKIVLYRQVFSVDVKNIIESHCSI